jgi:hypothetical protein
MNKRRVLLIDQAFERPYYSVSCLKLVIGGKVMTENQKVPGRGSPPETPRWVKVLIILFIVLVAAVVALHLMGFGFGGHGSINAAEMFARGQIDYVTYGQILV